MLTFGQVIAETRKERQLSQKELALMIKKENGQPISPQYLNDIERDRRNPPGGYILEQFSRVLNLDLNYLYFLAGEIPASLRNISADPERISEAIRVFRQTLEKKNDMGS